MKKFLSVLLAAALAAALLASPAAAAAPQPWVQVEGKGTDSQTIQVRGVSGSIDAVQVTLHLDQIPGSFDFDETLGGGDTHTAVTQDGNNLTLYVTSKNQLNQADAILLGTLSGSGITVVSVSGLKLVDMDQKNVPEQSFGTTGMEPPADGSGTNNSGTTGFPSSGPVYPDAGIIFPITGTGSSGSGTGSSGAGAGSSGTGTSSSGAGAPVSGPLPFADVKAGDWFYDAVAYVYSMGLMNGTSPTAFSPHQTTTRGMIVTILYRCEGSPAAGASAFQDVAAGQYYTSAVAWAAENGVVNGYSPTQFGPNDPITREQMAAILYRYAQYKGIDVNRKTDYYGGLSSYIDGNLVSAYAREAMAWANREILITGVDKYLLQPGGSATRAQVATILTRFRQNIAQ